MTPIQMANIAAIIANRGWYYTPHFVKKIGKNGPLDAYKTKHFTKVNARHFEPIIDGMWRVVHESGGTGKEAQLKEIVVCGKTGTVQNGPNRENHSVFIAFAPRENPKIALAVFVENAGAGGSFAAPIAGLMIEKYLKKVVTNEAKEKKIINTKILR